MAPSAIVALCLLALASAAPQNLQDLKCAKSCDPTKQINVENVGKTFKFDYNVQSFVKLSGVNDALTQGGLNGVVDITRINPCEIAIKFTSSDATAKVNQYPIVVALEENQQQDGDICTHPDDDAESIKIKWGIASSMLYTVIRDTSAEKIVVPGESSVLGICPTTYSVKRNGQKLVVTKEIVHSECHHNGFSFSSQSKVPSLLHNAPSPVQESKTVCTMTHSDIPEKITCKDTKVVGSSLGSSKYIEATQESTLTFVSISDDMSVLSSINNKQISISDLRNYQSKLTKNPELDGKLDTVLKEVCKKVQGQGHPDTASIVNKAIELLELIPGEAFITVLSKIRAGDYCTDYSRLEALYLDAIAFIGEPGTLKVIAQEVSAGRVTGGRTALYTAALHLLTNPTVKHAEALTPIVAMEDPSSTLSLAAASVINKHCKLTSGCKTCPIVKNILKILTDKLDIQCTPAFSNSKPSTVLTTLKTLGNIGYLAAEHAEKVVNCAKTEGVETNVRFAATLALKGTPCKTQVKSALKAIVLNKEMNTEVRIGSYLAVIKCADADDLQELLSKITVDSNKQVQSFVLSHLNNLKKTDWPMKSHLQELLNNVNLPSTYESNIFKFSQNKELSYNTPILGVGAAVESNVVYAPDSYIPRLIKLGLDMNLLGSFVNIGEVGARVEGLDPIMKEVFGPESYLYKTPLSAVFKDTSLFIKENGANIFNKLEKLIKDGKSADINSLIQSVSMFLKANNIKLPKTDLYAKLFGQEFAFLSVAGPMQEVNVNNVVETLTSAVLDALIAAKDLNVNTARAAHYHFDYAIPTIQGIPLKVKLMTTAVAGIEVQSKLDSKAKAHDAILKFIPNLSIAINGHIGYGNIMKHGLKIKNSIYTTNGIAVYASLKNGKDLDLKLELPEKMELIKFKSEIHQVKINKLMTEEKIFPSNMKDKRIEKEYCSAVAETVTGLHLCFKMNIPDVLNSNSLPLGAATQFNIYLQKSDHAMKGYRVTASFQNKAEKKALKLVAGTYGSSNSKETSVKISYTKESNAYLTAAEIKSAWFTSYAKTSFMYEGDLASLQILAHHKFKAERPMAVACKFDFKNEVIANGNEYLVSAFAGLTETLTETHKFLDMKMSHSTNGDLINANFLVNTESSVLPLSVEFGMDIPSRAPWFTVIRKVELKTSVGTNVVECLILRKLPGQYENTLTLSHGAANTLKFSNVINILEFLNYKITADVHINNEALLHMEGPVSWQLTKTMIKHNVDLKITGAFDGTFKVLHTALLSLEKIQYTLDMRYSETLITMINIIFDRTNPAETTTKAVINIPVLVNAEYVTVVTPKMLHTTMNTIIVPTTSYARRFKGYSEFDLEGLKLKTDFFWDAEKDNNKKIAFTTLFKTDKSLGKLLVQGDITLTTQTYGYKLESVLASPSKWFLGTTGLELAITAPSNKVMTAKALWSIEYSESLVILKPLVAVNTLNENKYEIAGSVALKKLPAMWNFDISSEVTVNVPQMQKMTIATKLLHEDNNGACATVFKIGVTGLYAPTAFEITHGATSNKYTTLFKLQHGSTVGSVATNVALISGFKAFDITIDASLPFAVVKALSMRATKTTEGILTFTFSKNQMVLAKLHYTMTNWTAHTLSLECPSRTVEFFASFSSNEITMKIFPEKNLSPKMLESIIRLTNKAGSTNIECFINAPSLSNEMRIAAEFSLVNPIMEKIVNVDIQFPTAEIKKLVPAMLEEIQKIYEDMVKDGVFPNLTVVYKELDLVLNELPIYLNTLKLQFVLNFAKYWTILRTWATTMWKNYEADLNSLFEFGLTQFVHYWQILKVEVPVLFDNLLTTIKKTEMWNVLNGLVKEIMEQYHVQFDILFDFYNKVILTAITEIKELLNKLTNLPSFQFEIVWNLLVKELPSIFIKIREQLLNSQVLNVIIGKMKTMEMQYPAIYAAVADIWAGFIKPVYTDILVIVQKLMNINLKDMSQLIDHLLKEIPRLFNNIMTRLMDTKVMKLFINMVKDFINANPMIRSIFEQVTAVLHKTTMALLGDLGMFYEKLMNIPEFRKIVEWVQHIINTKTINMDFSMTSALTTVDTFVTEVLGWTYTVTGDGHISAVVTLPVSVTTLKHFWSTITADLPAFVEDLINSLNAFMENLPVYIAAVKEQVAFFVKFAAEQIPVMIKAIETYVPKYINEFVPVINNFIVFMRNTEVFKFLMARINEVIKMYPAEFNLVKEYFEMFIKFAADYSTLVYNKMMEIPIIKTIVDYIWNLIYGKHVQSGMLSSLSSVASSLSSYSVSSWNSASSSLSTYSSAVSSNVPSFIKLHTPSMVSSWVSTLMQ